MQIPDLFTLTKDARITARAVLYLLTFLFGWWGGHMFGTRHRHRYPMISLRHRLASGTLDNLWEYDSARKVVMLTVEGKHFDVPVCVEKYPKQGHYALRRLSDTEWRVAPTYFHRRADGVWVTRADAFPNSTVDVFVCLTHAPTQISKELDELVLGTDT